MNLTSTLFAELWDNDSDSSSENTKRYQSFLFNRYMSESMSTHVNMVPMLGGLSADAYEVMDIKERVTANLVVAEKGDPEWVWDTAHGNGFSALIEHAVALNHVFSKNFSTFSHFGPEWETEADKVEKETPVIQNDTRQPDCWGDEHLMEHKHREALEFLDSSTNIPKLVIMDSKSAHNKWPYASQYDVFLHNFLVDLMKRPIEVVIVLAADHGYGFQDKWEFDSKKYPGSDFERLLPFLGILVPKSVLRARPEVEQQLTTNQLRPISHYDLHLTLQNLVTTGPFTAPVRVERIVPFLQPVAKALDLFSTVVPQSRTCNNMGITSKSCLCEAWKDTQVNSEQALNAANRGIEYINKQRLKPSGACLVQTLGTVLSAQHKPKINVGYRHAVGEDNKFGDLVRVEFEGTPDTRWRVVMDVANNQVTELQVMHRYRPLEACWDGSAPLKFCGCKLDSSGSSGRSLQANLD